MTKKMLFFLLCSLAIGLLSCDNKADISNNTNGTNQNANSNITINSPEPAQNSLIFLGDTSLNSNTFQAGSNKNIYIDWRENNKILVFPKTLTTDMFPNLKKENTYNLFSSSDSIAVYNDQVIYSDITDYGYIHIADIISGESTKISEDQGYNFIVLGDDLYYINKLNNNVLTKYTLTNKSKVSITQDRVGKFIIIGDWIVYQNSSDSHKIYAVKTNGTSRTRLSNSSAESFGLYKNNILFVNSSDSDNLYLLTIETLEEKKIFDTKAEHIKSINNNVFFINKDDLNYVYSLNEDSELNFTSKKVSPDSVIDYYVFDNSIFYKRSLSPDSGVYRIENVFE